MLFSGVGKVDRTRCANDERTSCVLTSVLKILWEVNPSDPTIFSGIRPSSISLVRRVTCQLELADAM
jgi:hypothetical protein